MSEQAPQRRLVAILAADVVGYSRLMEADEACTLATLKARRRDILQPLLAKHNGRIVKVMGDGILAEQLLDGLDAGGTLGARVTAERVEAILLSNDARHARAPAMLMEAASTVPAAEPELARQLLCSALRAAVGSRELTAGTSCPRWPGRCWTCHGPTASALGPWT